MSEHLQDALSQQHYPNTSWWLWSSRLTYESQLLICEVGTSVTCLSEETNTSALLWKNADIFGAEWLVRGTYWGNLSVSHLCFLHTAHTVVASVPSHFLLWKMAPFSPLWITYQSRHGSGFLRPASVGQEWWDRSSFATRSYHPGAAARLSFFRDMQTGSVTMETPRHYHGHSVPKFMFHMWTTS